MARTAGFWRRQIKLRVLNVEDVVGQAGWLSLVLLAAGCEVRTAHCGAEAIAVAADFHPEVVLMDLMLPDIDGLEVARRILAGESGRPPVFIAVTGRGDEEIRQAVNDAGFSYFREKPIFSEEVVNLLSEIEAKLRNQTPPPRIRSVGSC